MTQAITENTAKRPFPHRIFWPVLGGVITLFFIILIVVSLIPPSIDVGEVASAEVCYSANGDPRTHVFTSTEDIESLLEVEKVAWKNESVYFPLVKMERWEFEITYTMKDGDTVTRSYLGYSEKGTISRMLNEISPQE
ncbi:MAG: hypothetical protein IJY56_00515 [Clostridia bacterium]|nr:hypothetical protein [Clostridia bacterium]